MRKKILSIQAVFITTTLIFSGILLNVSASKISNYDEDHPESYDIIIWRIKKGNVDKETFTVDYTTAMKIKAEYEQIEKNSNSIFEKMEQKNALMRKYGVLSQDETLENIINSAKPYLYDRLVQIKNRYKNDWPFLNIVVSVIGILYATVHGNVSGMNIGIPFPFTVTLVHVAEAHGPAEGFGTNIFIIPNLLKIEDNKQIVALMTIAAGVIEYLPFILNQNNEGQFMITCFTNFGFIGDPNYIPR